MYPELCLVGYFSCNSLEPFALVPPVVKAQIIIVTEGGDLETVFDLRRLCAISTPCLLTQTWKGKNHQ